MQQRFFRILSAVPFVSGTFINPAAAQVVIPYGDFGDGFEKYLIVVISLRTSLFCCMALLPKSLMIVIASTI